MFWKKRETIPDERLDRVAREMTRAAIAEDAEDAVSSPFLYSRLRARIADEQERRTSPTNAWGAMLAAARLAIPALVIIAIAVTAIFWITEAGARPRNIVNIDMPEMGYGGIAPLQACSVSDSTGCNVSTDEVIANLFREERQELR